MDIQDRPLVICHSDWGDDPYAMGKVLELFDDGALMLLVSAVGRWEGLMLFDTEELDDIEKDSPNTRRLETLLSIKGQVMPEPPARMASGMDTILTYARERRKIVALELHASGSPDVIGYVLQVGGEEIRIDRYDPYGEGAGAEDLPRDSITRVFCGGEALEDIGLLIEHNK